MKRTAHHPPASPAHDAPTGIIIVDHGSRLEESNQMLEQLAVLFAKRFADRYSIVEPAHMEIAEPSIATAYGRCASRGARHIVVCPFFLGPGKHWTSDIPRLTADAANDSPGTTFHVTQTLGIDDLILDLLEKRIGFCRENAYECDRCRGTLRCRAKISDAGLNATTGDDVKRTLGCLLDVCFPFSH